LFSPDALIEIASNRHEAAKAGFDYRGSYYFFNEGEPDAMLQVNKLVIGGSNTPFELFRTQRNYGN